MSTTLYRAADDDFVRQGTCFAESIDDARAYQDNPGFGGATLWTAEADGTVLDLTADPMDTLASVTGISRDDLAMGCHGDRDIPQVIQRYPGLMDTLAALGYDWVRYCDDYPEGCITWTALSDDAAWTEMTEIDD